MYYEFLAKDVVDHRDTLVSQGDIEYLGDVLELFLAFLQGAGYSYIGKITATSKGGDKEWETL